MLRSHGQFPRCVCQPYRSNGREGQNKPSCTAWPRCRAVDSRAPPEAIVFFIGDRHLI